MNHYISSSSSSSSLLSSSSSSSLSLGNSARVAANLKSLFIMAIKNQKPKGVKIKGECEVETLRLPGNRIGVIVHLEDNRYMLVDHTGYDSLFKFLNLSNKNIFIFQS